MKDSLHAIHQAIGMVRPPAHDVGALHEYTRRLNEYTSDQCNAARRWCWLAVACSVASIAMTVVRWILAP